MILCNSDLKLYLLQNSIWGGTSFPVYSLCPAEVYREESLYRAYSYLYIRDSRERRMEMVAIRDGIRHKSQLLLIINKVTNLPKNENLSDLQKTAIVYGSTALVDLGRFFTFLIYAESLGLLGRGISPSQGHYLYTEHHTHRINASRHPCLEWDSNQRSLSSSGRRRFMPQTPQTASPL
jgi:hypothetical protein